MKQSNETIQIIELLKEKNRLFVQYEEATDLLVKFDPEKAEDYVNKRDKIASSIKDLNEKIKTICDTSQDGDDIRDAMYNKIKWSECSEEYQPIFKNGQDLISAISRIKRKNITIVERVEGVKDTIKEQIKKQNTGGMGKSAKYYRSTNPMGDQKFKILNTKL